MRYHHAFAIALCVCPATLTLAQQPPAEWLPKILSGDMLFTPQDTSVSGSNMPIIANGMLGTQLMADTVYVSGIYNGDGSMGGANVSKRARLQATAAIGAPGIGSLAALDIREATYYRRSYVDPASPGTCTASSIASCTNSNSRVWIEQRFYAHRAMPSLFVMEVQILPPSPPQNNATTAAAAAAEPYAMLRLVNSPGQPSTDVSLTPVGVPPNSPYSIVSGTTNMAENNASVATLAVLTTNLPPGSMLQIDGVANYSTFAFLTVVRTSIETPADHVISSAESDFGSAMAMAEAGTLHASHVAEWAATVWPSGFETDRTDFARAVNTSIYGIVSSQRVDRVFSTSPGGLASACYEGHVFWDLESWMFAPMLLLHPDIAGMNLRYRLDRLPGAQFKATTYNPPYSGAMFAWESAVSGREVAPAPWGTDEIHISSDIAFAVWQFWSSSRDNSGGWLNSTAWPLLSGIATFWMSKLAVDNPGAPAGSPLSLKHVMGPDEDHDPVDNSAFTNAGAILSLRRAADVARLLGMPSGVYAAWEDAAARVVIPYDAALKYHPEYDGYQPGTLVKQADTILLGFPLEIDFNMTPEVRFNDLTMYGGNVTDEGGPAMTWGMFAIGYIELGAGFEGQARANFNRSFANVQLPFDVWMETPTGGCPNFLTGAGGFLQTAFNGYPGLRINATAANFNPVLPELTARITLRSFAYLGNRITVAYNASAVTATLLPVVPAAQVDALVGSEVAPLRKYHIAGPSAARAAPLNASSSARFSLAPKGPLSARSQLGRVVVGNGVVVTPQALEVIDALGVSHPLLTGVTVTLSPLQKFSIVAAR